MKLQLIIMREPYYLWSVNNMLRNQPDQKRLAILIDTENTSPYKIEEILSEISTLGKAIIRRAYGDWTQQKMDVWKQLLVRNSIQPHQQFSYSVGKNSTDSALIIDAMDLLYQHELDGFCIVSSDSDFTKLAVRLRESGLLVYGFGEKQTPKSFSQACDKFTYLENLSKGPLDFSRMQELLKDEELVSLVKSAVEDASDESGWALLAKIGQIIYNNKPDFDPRSYGFKKLSDLIRNMGIFQIEERRSSEAVNPVIFVSYPLK